MTRPARRSGRLRRAAGFVADKLLAPFVVVVASGVIVFLVTRGQTSEPAATTTVLAAPPSSQPAAPAFPLLHRGAGKEQLRAGGSYGGTGFRARGALVREYSEGAVQIVFYPYAITCSVADAGQPSGLSYTAVVTVVPATLRVLPVGRPLSTFQLWWDRSQPDRTDSDEASEAATMELTAVDTTPGGFWRGRIRSTRRSATDTPQRFGGTFAAEWCIGSGP